MAHVWAAFCGVRTQIPSVAGAAWSQTVTSLELSYWMAAMEMEIHALVPLLMHAIALAHTYTAHTSTITYDIRSRERKSLWLWHTRPIAITYRMIQTICVCDMSTVAGLVPHTQTHAHVCVLNLSHNVQLRWAQIRALLSIRGSSAMRYEYNVVPESVCNRHSSRVYACIYCIYTRRSCGWKCDMGVSSVSPLTSFRSR